MRQKLLLGLVLNLKKQYIQYMKKVMLSEKQVHNNRVDRECKDHLI